MRSNGNIIIYIKFYLDISLGAARDLILDLICSSVRFRKEVRVRQGSVFGLHDLAMQIQTYCIQSHVYDISQRWEDIKYFWEVEISCGVACETIKTNSF